MHHYISRRYLLIIVTVALLLLATGALLAQGAAQYASAPDQTPREALAATPTPVPGGPGFISQTALAFQGWPRENIPTGYNGVMLYNPDSASHAYEAMISLPHGVKITKLTAWYYDNNAGEDKNLWLVIARARLNGTDIVQIARVDSSGAASSVRVAEDTTILTPVVDNQNYIYWVETFLPSGARLGVVSF